MTTPDPTPASVDSVMTLVLGYGDSTTFEEIIAEVERLAAQSAPLAQQAREYPPLPSPKYKFDTGGGWLANTEGFTADQLRAYVDADRAARVSPAEKTARMLTVNEFNVGRFCLSEDDCIAQGIDFSAYERGVADAAEAFSRNT